MDITCKDSVGNSCSSRTRELLSACSHVPTCQSFAFMLCCEHTTTTRYRDGRPCSRPRRPLRRKRRTFYPLEECLSSCDAYISIFLNHIKRCKYSYCTRRLSVVCHKQVYTVQGEDVYTAVCAVTQQLLRRDHIL